MAPQFKVQLLLPILLLTLLAAEGASTPPGIAKNPSNSRCLIKKYKHCYNLVHVCPKFCPDSCTVECVSCKPICSGGSTPPTLTPPTTPSTPSPKPPKTPPTPSPAPPTTPSTPAPTPPATPAPTPPTPSTPTPTPPTTPSPTPPKTPSTPAPTPPTTPPTPPTTPTTPAPTPPTTPAPTPPTTPSTPSPTPPSNPAPTPPTTPSTPAPTPPTTPPSPPTTPSTPAPTPPTTPSPTPPTSPSTPSPTPPPPTPPTTPSTPSPTPPTTPSTPSPTPPTTPSIPSPAPPTTPSSPSSEAAPMTAKCKNKNYPQCYNTAHVCPNACPGGCEVDCVTCKPVCSCDRPGAVCQDPRFIGGDGITFYFHGKKDKDFCLVSDSNLHINAHFIGRRNQNMKRDFTWVQSIAILFDKHQLYMGALKTSTWDDSVDRLALAFDGESITLPETTGSGSQWQSNTVSITRVSDTNNVVVELKGKFQITVKVVPITEKESRVHNYGITNEDCFAHLEIGFKFYSLSDEVNGVLGQTYRPNYVTKVNMGAKMPVMGGDRDFETSSLLAADCAVARFNGNNGDSSTMGLDLPSLNCASGIDGQGVVCKR